MSAPHEDPVIPAGNDEDAMEQQLPAVPGAEEDSEETAPPHGDLLLPGGSEADRLDQARDGGGTDGEEDYPRDAEAGYPEDAEP